MPNVKMGFEGQIYRGASGATAATQLLNVEDITYNLDLEKGNTTVRGAGTSPPIETEDLTLFKVSIEFSMINDTTDADLSALKTAAYAGTGIALRLKDNAAGKGFDGDVFLSLDHAEPLKGEQKITFKATPSRSFGRAPLLYV